MLMVNCISGHKTSVSIRVKTLFGNPKNKNKNSKNQNYQIQDW